nr:putative membrane protein [Rhodococcus sp. JVH1]
MVMVPNPDPREDRSRVPRTVRTRGRHPVSLRAQSATALVTAALAVAVVASVDWQLCRGVFSPTELALFVIVGVVFVSAGLVAKWHRPQDNLGWLLVFAGLLWLVKGFRLSTVPALFTAGAALTNMYIPVLIQLVFSFPWGRLRHRWERWFVGGSYAYYAVAVVSELAFLDTHRVSPAHPPSLNLLLVRDDPRVFAALQVIFGAVGIALGVVLIGVVVARWRSGSPAYRAAVAPLWIAALLGTAATAWTPLVSVWVHSPQHAWTLLLRYPSTALIPLAVLAGMWRYRVARAAVRNLMIEIGTAPLGDGFIEALRAALRDPDLALWSFSRARDGYVDAQGRPQVLPPRNDPREATALIRDGVLVGALVYDRAVADLPRLLAAVRAATTLALDNQRLHGELEAQFAEVRRARE